MLGTIRLIQELDQEVLPGRAPTAALATARAAVQCDLSVVHNNIMNRELDYKQMIYIHIGWSATPPHATHTQARSNL